jgi:hypothetical protein
MKKLYLLVMVIALAAVMVIPTGGVFAAPPPLHNHYPTPVSGTLEFVDWNIDNVINTFDPTTGMSVSYNNILTWEMHGDLEGTYVMNLAYIQYWDLSNPTISPLPYTMTGTETFEGTLMGHRVSYRAEQVGSGLFACPPFAPPNFNFAGSESWESTIISADSPLSHLRGVITVSGIFDFNAGISDYEYSGELVWQTGKKN